MNIGWHSVCLKCRDLAASRAFYEALGMEVTHADDHWVQLTNGNLQLSLMTFLGENWITFRGADIDAVHAATRSKGISAEGAPEAYTADQMGSDGRHWNTRDPDGNVVYFDTTADEEPKSKQVESLLQDLERYLSNAGIESSSFAEFKTELTQRYITG